MSTINSDEPPAERNSSVSLTSAAVGINETARLLDTRLTRTRKTNTKDHSINREQQLHVNQGLIHRDHLCLSVNLWWDYISSIQRDQCDQWKITQWYISCFLINLELCNQEMTCTCMSNLLKTNIFLSNKYTLKILWYMPGLSDSS